MSNFGIFKNLDFSQVKYYSHIEVDHEYLVTTSMFTYARNHCAATSSTNLEYILNKSHNFLDHHAVIGDGPVMMFARKTRKIFKEKNIAIDYKTKLFHKQVYIMDEIDKDNPVMLLLSAGLLDWHWVICTGYLIMEDDSLILEIMDNWNRDKRYYRPGYGSSLISATSYFKI